MKDPVMTEFRLIKVRPRYYPYWGRYMKRWRWPFRMELTVVWRALNGAHGNTHKLYVGDILEISNPNMTIDPTPVHCDCELCAAKMRRRLKL